MSGKSFKPRRLSNPPFQMLWKWLEQGGSQTGNGQHHHGTTIAGVVGLNEANLREIEAKTAATTWRKLIGLGIGILGVHILGLAACTCCIILKGNVDSLRFGIGIHGTFHGINVIVKLLGMFL